jgi:hypothetical protein
VDFTVWLVEFIIKHDRSAITTLASYLYSIWHACNQWIFENKIAHGEVLIQRACNNITCFQQGKVSVPDLDLSHPCSSPHSQHHASKQASLSSRVVVPTRDPALTKWVKPAKGFIKVNSDVSLAYQEHWGVGVIARTDTGVLVAACTKLRPGFNCVCTAEA